MTVGQCLVHFLFNAAVVADMGDGLVVEPCIGVVAGLALGELGVVGVVDGRVDGVARAELVYAAAESDVVVGGGTVQAGKRLVQFVDALPQRGFVR